jgi:hypothetical protein
MREPSTSVAEDLDLLSLDFISEQLGFVRMYAEIAQRECEAGDKVGLHYHLGRMIAHVKSGAGEYKDMAARNSETNPREAA